MDYRHKTVVTKVNSSRSDSATASDHDDNVEILLRGGYRVVTSQVSFGDFGSIAAFVTFLVKEYPDE